MLAPYRRPIAWAVLGTALFLALLAWAWLLFRLQTAAALMGMSLGDALQLDDPALREQLFLTLRSKGSPSGLIVVMGWPQLALLFGVGVAVSWLWSAVRVAEEREAGRILMVSLAVVPALVGLALAPLALRATFAALARAGVSSPALIGMGYAEALLRPLVGTIVAVLTLVSFPLHLRSAQASPPENLP
jgi:hypothetical protein